MTDKDQLFDFLLRRLNDGNKHTIRIFGHGGSGKSSFAQGLLTLLPSEQVNLLETDPYIIKGSYRDLVSAKAFPDQKVTACLPVAHELASLERDIKALQSGLDILTIDEPWSPSQLLKAEKPILLVEGMSAAFLPNELFDLSICFYTDGKTELGRRLNRDVSSRQRQPDWIEKTHQARRQQYETYYKPYEAEADILVNQSDNAFRIERGII